MTFANLIRLGSVIFVVAVLFYVLFHSINGAQPNSLAFYLFSYSLAALGVAFVSGGVVDLVVHRRYAFGWWTAGKTLASAVAGVGLTLISAPFPPYGIFEISYAGFPIPFSSSTTLIGETFTTGYPQAFAIDCAFWIALAYPLVWFVGSVATGRLNLVGRLEGLTVAASLTYDVYPGWVVLAESAIGYSLYQVSPWSFLAFFFLPSFIVGALIAAKGNRRLGLTIVLASLMFDSLLGLAYLGASLHVVL